MNVADSQRVGSALEHLGYLFTGSAEEADVIVLNTCVVRQSAEDKAYGRLHSLKPLKASHPGLVINLMGCLVGIRNDEKLRARFPFVDVFSPPSDPGPLVSFLTQGEAQALEAVQDIRPVRCPGWRPGDPSQNGAAPRTRARAHRLGARAGGAGLLARLHLLHHPVQAGRGTFTTGGGNPGGGALARHAGCKGSDPAGADR